MKNIDDMRVGDFLYLIDMMQEECCNTKKCITCKYHYICEGDSVSLDTLSVRKTVQEYAEANGLLDHMNYVDDQKWIPCSERLPEFGTDVMIQCDDGHIDVGYLENKLRSLRWTSYLVVYSFGYVAAWMPLPKKYEGEKK